MYTMLQATSFAFLRCAEDKGRHRVFPGNPDGQSIVRPLVKSSPILRVATSSACWLYTRLFCCFSCVLCLDISLEVRETICRLYSPVHQHARSPCYALLSEPVQLHAIKKSEVPAICVFWGCSVLWYFVCP